MIHQNVIALTVMAYSLEQDLQTDSHRTDIFNQPARVPQALSSCKCIHNYMTGSTGMASGAPFMFLIAIVTCRQITTSILIQV